MNDHDVHEVRDAVERWGKTDQYIGEYTKFLTSRKGHEVRIEVLDTGRDGDQYRWTATVTDMVTGFEIAGNGAETIDAAFSMIHWNELDLPREQ